MGRLTRVRPTLTVTRKEVSLAIQVETDESEIINEGDTFFLRIEGGRNEDMDIPTVRVKHANYITKAMKRHWTLHVDYA